ncbi:putative 1-phosphatidylinositol 3-phosphate 5-kinase [Aphis craccivora]|uniref:1-phosphatidylinositol-3-phosphate 5-kinase n=1 Tax=Aphis craccivora TaxID=307492 RepID=A0A6G0XHC6_APHCR|nr:putative 1-phosphatidylinositol 3-phosphate 5-kinase [Aphis craccivora]
MKPDLVLVQKSVSRIAQEIFNQMGVTLVLNVKTSVLERIARCTGAEILTSIDAHMGKSVLGTCQQFCIENFGNKALMFFEGCPVPEEGCSVLLRGSSNKQLKILKKKSYIMDQFASLKMTELNNLQPLSTNTEQDNKYQYVLNSTLLSLSPLVNFSVPYLESNIGKHCKSRKYFSKHIYVSQILNNMKSSIDCNQENEPLESEINIYGSFIINYYLKTKHAFTMSKLTEDINGDEVQTMLALFRFQGEKLVDIFDPVNHQRLPVMFYSFCPESNNAPSFCVEPRLVFMEFYGVNDIFLGRFLERYCFRDTYECPSDSCDSPMNRHERRFIHDTRTILNTIWKLDDTMALLKRAVSEAAINWNSKLIKIEAAIKKRDKSQRKSETKSNNLSEVLEEIINFKCDSNRYVIEEHNITSHLRQHLLVSESEIAAEHDFENLNDSDICQSEKFDSNVPNEPKTQLSMSQNDKKKIQLKSQNTMYVLNIHCRTPISIYEKEPSSSIAFTLSTSFYHNNISNTEFISTVEQVELHNDQKETDEKSKQHIEVYDRFILKEMSRLEILPFLELAPQHFVYIRRTNRRPTLLCKIVGVYKVKYRNTVKGSSFNSNLLVMENLFYNKNISHIFDLKRSVRNRLVDSNSQDGEIVLLDENLIKIGLDEDSGELVLGIMMSFQFY